MKTRISVIHDCDLEKLKETGLEFIDLKRKAALDFFNDFFRSVTEGRSDYELIAQEALG